MKYLLLLVLLNAIFSTSLAQKEIIDSSVFDKWPSLDNPIISGDGKYVIYTINNIPEASHTLIIQATNNKWRKQIIKASDAHFTRDDKKVVYQSPGDSLFILELGSDRCKYYTNVLAYRLVTSQKIEWLAIQMTGEAKGLILQSIETKTVKYFTHITEYAASSTGESILIQTEERFGSQIKNELRWINLEKGYSKVIWDSRSDLDAPSRARSILFDIRGEQVVFLVTRQRNGKRETSIWHYKSGQNQAVERINGKTQGMPEASEIETCKFRNDGARLFFDLVKYVNRSRPSHGVMVDIWSYTDDKLQAQQLLEAPTPVFYTGLFDSDNSKVVLLQGKDERLYHGNSDDYKLLTKSPCYFEESNWRSSCLESLYLVNTSDGSRQLIKDSLVKSYVNALSPDREYAVYYDWKHKAFFSYNISSGGTVNITQNVPFLIYDTQHARAGLPGPYSVTVSWLPAKKAIIIYDEYDIWQIDLAGLKPAVCSTNGYGRKQGIIFRLLKETRIITEQQVLLSAFRRSDKANGFYLLDLTKCEYPELLTMAPYFYYWPSIANLMAPQRAAHTDTWLLQRMSATEAPDYFITRNFKTFQQISNIQPQETYNWLTSELHEWTLLNGKRLQGILYKPENFDPHKKYPVIFHFYEEKSDELNVYIKPEATGGHINIPHFVSNGYLVFVPDILYINVEPAECIYNAVVSAAKYVAKMPFVDSTRMGLQGHSWGGYEVNVLITRTNIFTAAAEVAGPTDFVSGYGSASRGGNSNQFHYETGQMRMQATLWDKPDLYIKNSPIFFANNVKTPLLIMHCKQDDAVPFEQGLEWFAALRRLKKKVWMLQYDMGGHQVVGKEARDYTIRLMQFFEHYLKGAPAPKWMIEGVPANLKGLKTGYDFMEQ